MSSPPSFPTEILHDIIRPLVEEQIDLALAGPLAYVLRPLSQQYDPAPTKEADHEAMVAFVRDCPLLPLLSVSVRMHNVTLQVLSDALDISYDNDVKGLVK